MARCGSCQAWELSVAGHPLDLGVLIPGLVVPSLFFTRLALYPLTDRRIVGGRPPRGLLPPTPPDLANRAAAGVAGVTFYGLLWAAAPRPIPTTCKSLLHGHLDLPGVLATPRWRPYHPGRCHGGRPATRRELHGRETGRILMNPQGGYDEIREPAHQAALPSADPPGPAVAATGTLPRATPL